MKFGVIDFFWASLQIVFVVLKLCGVIDWPWWLVLSPMLLAVPLAVLLSILFLVVALWVKNYAEHSDRRTKEKMYGTANPLKIRMVKMQRQREELERMRTELKESDELLDKLEREKQEKE